jgi:hypothetical protein
MFDPLQWEQVGDDLLEASTTHYLYRIETQGGMVVLGEYRLQRMQTAFDNDVDHFKMLAQSYVTERYLRNEIHDEEIIRRPGRSRARSWLRNVVRSARMR